MANVINMGGSGANVESKTVKSSQTQQTITPPNGVDGFNPVIVSPFKLQSKSINPSKVPYTVKPDTGYDGLSMVTFEKAAYLVPGVISYKREIYGVVGTAKNAIAGPDVNMIFAGASDARIVFSYYSDHWLEEGSTFMRLVNSSNNGLLLSSAGRAYFVCDFYGTSMTASIMLALFNENTKQASIYYSSTASITKGTDHTMMVSGIPIAASAGITGTFTKGSNLSNYATNLEGYYI